MIKIDPEIVGPEISGIEKDSTRVAEFHHKTSLTCEAILLILDLLCSSCFQKNTWVVCWLLDWDTRNSKQALNSFDDG